jgi:hypothetical protein
MQLVPLNVTLYSHQLLVERDIEKMSGRKQACCSTMHPGARLIKKVFNIDPMICHSCNGNMKIISFIEDQRTVKKILIHLDLWMNHDPPGYDVPVFSIENLQLELEPFASHNVNSILNYSMFEDDFSQEVFYNIQLKKFF